MKHTRSNSRRSFLKHASLASLAASIPLSEAVANSLKETNPQTVDRGNRLTFLITAYLHA